MWNFETNTNSHNVEQVCKNISSVLSLIDNQIREKIKLL